MRSQHMITVGILFVICVGLMAGPVYSARYDQSVVLQGPVKRQGLSLGSEEIMINSRQRNEGDEKFIRSNQNPYDFCLRDWTLCSGRGVWRHAE
ncbi:MAG: hypothetical protein NPIRA05_13640 [Nitrospirales bacterium]|nr:MAG: hypothetical protein NPIRA05_13640 [Nitrospirales bacterium]